MTICEHCKDLGGVASACFPLSSEVIVTNGASREQHFKIQPCPSLGVVELGGSACPVALEASKRHPAMMPRRQWASYEVELHQAKAQQGRVFGPTIKTIRYNR